MGEIVIAELLSENPLAGLVGMFSQFSQFMMTILLPSFAISMASILVFLFAKSAKSVSEVVKE